MVGENCHLCQEAIARVPSLKWSSYRMRRCGNNRKSTQVSSGEYPMTFTGINDWRKKLSREWVELFHVRCFPRSYLPPCSIKDPFIITKTDLLTSLLIKHSPQWRVLTVDL